MAKLLICTGLIAFSLLDLASQVYAINCTGGLITFSLLDLACQVYAINCTGDTFYCCFTANARQPWTDSRDCYSEYLIAHFDSLIIPFDYLIKG